MIHRGDLFDVLPTLDAESIDACVTDPPYGIGFMGREWDTFKPGTGATRKLMHPREREAAKAIVSDNPNINGRHRSPALSPSQIDYDYSTAGLRAFQDWTERWGREVFRVLKPGAYIVVCCAPRSYHRMACGIEDAGFVIRDKFSWLFLSGFPKNYNLGDGKGTALKPAHEPIALAWKPFKGSIKACHAAHGTAALNIDACRVEGDKQSGSGVPFGGRTFEGGAGSGRDGEFDIALGRWPANVLMECPDVFPDVAPYYYVAKPSRSERDEGIYDLPQRTAAELTGRKPGSKGLQNPRAGIRAGSMDRDIAARVARNIHPTVKPVELMRWLVRLVTPPDGVVLDPFTGSGTTGMACRYELRRFIGIERESEYADIAERRIAACVPLFGNDERQVV